MSNDQPHTRRARASSTGDSPSADPRSEATMSQSSDFRRGMVVVIAASAGLWLAIILAVVGLR